MAPSAKFSLVSWIFILVLGFANLSTNHQHTNKFVKVKHVKLTPSLQKSYGA